MRGTDTDFLKGRTWTAEMLRGSSLTIALLLFFWFILAIDCKSLSLLSLYLLISTYQVEKETPWTCPTPSNPPNVHLLLHTRQKPYRTPLFSFSLYLVFNS